MQALEEFKLKNKVLRIVYDPDPMNPRTDWDNLGTIAYKQGSRYILGDAALTEEQLQAIQESADFVCLPVYAYIHSSVMLSAGNANPFSCQWDSGQSGIVYISRKKLIAEYGDDSKESVDKAIKVMKAEVETYSQYLQGQVYGFEIVELSECDHGHTHETLIDSCYGFFGYDLKENGILDHIPEEFQEVIKAEILD